MSALSEEAESNANLMLEHERHFVCELDDCMWPDPSPALPEPDRHEWRPHGPKINDVTRMSGFEGTEVDRVFFPRTAEDIRTVVRLAGRNGRKVGVRGTKHSMGGHSITPWGYTLDMKMMTSMQYNPSDNTVTCGTGCMWADLLKYLNDFGRSPQTMQSYSTFSVGGSMSVNAHGITTDCTVSDCVLSFRLLKANCVEVVCSREADPGSEEKELFGLALGGYGLFGIIYEVTMKVSDNVILEQDVMNTTTAAPAGQDSSQFERIFHASRQRSGGSLEAACEIRLARLNITDTSKASIYMFKRASMPTVSPLGHEPHQISMKSQILYKWAMPAMKELRYEMEEQSSSALDLQSDQQITRNELMFESAVPLARLYNPILYVDSTFVLQEYFVPSTNFQKWIRLTAHVYADLNENQHLILLNTTVRFVECDKDTVLAYSQAEEGMFAFVLYYRLNRSSEAEAELKQYHHRFSEETLKCSGTFYLPYRQHYTDEQMLKAYPMLPAFLRGKQKHDPEGVFTNMWFEAYLVKHLPEEYRLKFTSSPATCDVWAESPEPLLAVSGYTPPMPETLVRRHDSYRRLLRSTRMRKEFRDQFLVNIFNLQSNRQIFNLMSKCAWDPANKDDIDIYRALKRELSHVSGGLMAEATKMWKAVSQLARQKRELTREVGCILARLGRIGEVHDYVSIGDHGKLVLKLRSAIGMRGNAWVLHDAFSEELPAVLERGALDHVGKFVKFDLNLCTGLEEVPDEAADLVTMNQGLHHLRPDRVMQFLAQVLRMLRPGGLFIVREHNLNRELDPSTNDVQGRMGCPVEMLDLAHSVFNAVTGVSEDEEKREIRAFRPIAEWRKIITAAGLCDSYLYEMELGDPSWDEMMCFYKPPLRPSPTARSTNVPLMSREQSLNLVKEQPQLPPALQIFAGQVPMHVATAATQFLQAVRVALPALSEKACGLAEMLPVGPKAVANAAIDRFVSFAQDVVSRIDSLFQNAGIIKEVRLEHVFPSELFLILPLLKKKVETKKASAAEELVVNFVSDLEGMFGDNSSDPISESAASTSVPSTSGSSAANVTTQEVEATLKELMAAMPALTDRSTVENSGFTLRQQSTLMTQFLKSTVRDTADKVAWYFDREGWNRCKNALDRAKAKKELPTRELVFGERGSSPWHDAFMAFLENPNVRFTSVAKVGLKFAGLSNVIKLWEEAQKQRQVRNKTAGKASAFQLDAQVSALIEGMAGAVGHGQVMRATHNQSDLSRGVTFQNVSKVVKATYGYTSLTASPTDITELLQRFFERKSVQNGSSLMVNVRILEDLRSMKLGSQDQLEMDAARRGIVSLVTLGGGGQGTLEIIYQTVSSPANILASAKELCQCLHANGVTRNLHENDGEYTWYKLNEWMQVEMLQILGKSLEHTPWYRFEFMQFLRIYFETLVKSSGVVKEKYGTKKAYMSSAFATDLIPGIVMTALFAQLQLLAMPLLSITPEDGYKGHDQSRLMEDLIVHVRTAVDWKRVDERINARCIVPGLFLLHSPTFKGLGEVVKNISGKVPSARLIEISNQKEINVRVLVREARQIDQIKGHPGVRVMLDYKFPTDGTEQPPDTNVSVEVQVPLLLEFIRECARMRPEVSIEQIYDFWRG